VGGLHLVILVEVLQEILVDRVQVCDEEIVHGTHHGLSRHGEKYAFRTANTEGSPGLRDTEHLLGNLLLPQFENPSRSMGHSTGV
jgi:hypothetical protein